jgi:toxin ParE1/3/4
VTDIRWAALARSDLSRIDRFHREIDPALADEINDRIIAATGILADLPYAGPASLRRDRRKWRVPKTRFILFYRVAADHVRILRVLHGAQDVTGRQ